MKIMYTNSAEQRAYGGSRYHDEKNKETRYPVLGLLSLEDGKVYCFEDMLRPHARRRLWMLGSGGRCDIRFDDRYVSRGHCVMHRDVRTRRVTIVDAGSKNGVYINNIKIHAAELEPGDVVNIGKSHLYAYGAAHFRVIVGLDRRPYTAKVAKPRGGIRRAARKLAMRLGWCRDRRRVSSSHG